MTNYIKDVFTVIQTAGETYVGIDEGEDNTYLVTPYLIESGDLIVLNDQKGNNTIQLVAGLEITSSIIAINEVVLTFSNGAQLDIRDADQFVFDIGGNDVIGEVGEEKMFSEFVEQILGATFPQEGEITQGGNVIINSPSNQIVSVDVGTLISPEALDASGGAFVFTDDSNVENYVEISNFSQDDVITVSEEFANAYSFTNDGSNVEIIFSADGGIINRITLLGVVDSDVVVYDEASFETAIGFDAFT